MTWWYNRDYVSVAEKRRKAERIVEKLRKERPDLRPVRIQGRLLSRTFWGKEWCRQMDLAADYDNRLPRGRSYVRNGAVCHLEIRQGEIEALVSGTELYTVTVQVAPLPRRHWQLIQAACKEKISTLVDLLQGKLSKEVLAVVCHPETGIFPKPAEISYACSCPDWAALCKHAAAALYGVGNRLDEEPELLFLLRHVDPRELFTLDVTAPAGAGEAAALHGVDLGGLFGIDLTEENTVASEPPKPPVPAEDTARAARRTENQTAGRSGEQAKKQTGKRAGKATANRTEKQAAKKTAQSTAKQTGQSTGKQRTRQGRTAQQTEKQAAEQAAQSTAKRRSVRAAAPQPPAQATGGALPGGKVRVAASPPEKAPASVDAKKRSAGRKRAETNAVPALPDLDVDRVSGADIAALREAFGLSHSSFAYRLDVSLTTVERWEKAPSSIVMQRQSRKKLLALYKKLQRKAALSRQEKPDTGRH